MHFALGFELAHLGVKCHLRFGQCRIVRFVACKLCCERLVSRRH